MIHIKEDIIIFHNKDSKMHRDNGPAIIEGNYQIWYQNGKYHREDGPAIISSYNIIWYIEGVYYNEFDYLAKQEHDHEKLKEMGLV